MFFLNKLLSTTNNKPYFEKVSKKTKHYESLTPILINLTTHYAFVSKNALKYFFKGNTAYYLMIYAVIHHVIRRITTYDTPYYYTYYAVLL